MKAIGFYKPLPISEQEALVDLDLPRPEPGPRDLLIRVEAVSVNPMDVKVRGSATPSADSPRVLGFDAAGIVEAVGPEVTLFRPAMRPFTPAPLTGLAAMRSSRSSMSASSGRVPTRSPSSRRRRCRSPR